MSMWQLKLLNLLKNLRKYNTKAFLLCHFPPLDSNCVIGPTESGACHRLARLFAGGLPSTSRDPGWPRPAAQPPLHCANVWHHPQVGHNARDELKVACMEHTVETLWVRHFDLWPLFDCTQPPALLIHGPAPAAHTGSSSGLQVLWGSKEFVPCLGQYCRGEFIHTHPHTHKHSPQAQQSTGLLWFLRCTGRPPLETLRVGHWKWVWAGAEKPSYWKDCPQRGQK